MRKETSNIRYSPNIYGETAKLSLATEVWNIDRPSPAYHHVPSRYCPPAAPFRLSIRRASSRYLEYGSSRRSKLQLWGLFKTDVVQHYMELCFDDDNLRLVDHASEHPASGRIFQENDSKTRNVGGGARGTRGSSCVRLKSAVRGN